MADVVELNGVLLLVEQAGAGEPTVVFVHGSWDDHRTWDRAAGAVSGTVLSYDRRGSGSRQPLDQGNIDEDVDDLIALIEWLDQGPVAVVGHSSGRPCRCCWRVAGPTWCTTSWPTNRRSSTCSETTRSTPRIWPRR